jgi:oligopeptide transport system permease protein
MVLALLGVSLPGFWVGILSVLYFSVQLGWFPPSGDVPLTEGGVGPWLASLIQPAVVLALFQIGFLARITRSAMLDVLDQDFIRTARAKGASELRVVLRHSLKGGLLPVVSFLGPAIAGILTGSFVIETIFQIPGIGREFVNSAFNRDYTLVLGTVILYAVLIMALNLAADVVQAWMNPKVRLEA